MLLDSSAIIEILTNKRDSITYSKIIETVSEEQIFISQMELAEISDWCVRFNLPIMERILAIKKVAQIVPLDDDICKEAALIKKTRRLAGFSGFGLIDGIILASAREIDQKLLTFDSHFEGENDCIVLVK